MTISFVSSLAALATSPSSRCLCLPSVLHLFAFGQAFSGCPSSLQEKQNRPGLNCIPDSGLHSFGCCCISISLHRILHLHGLISAFLANVSYGAMVPLGEVFVSFLELSGSTLIQIDCTKKNTISMSKTAVSRRPSPHVTGSAK